MTVSESRLEFRFGEEYGDRVLKYDDTEFYQRLFSLQPGCKAVDFIALSAKRILLIEVKNCTGNEAENRWRISTNNRKRDTVPVEHDVSDRDSLDIEVAQKTCMTLAALQGVHTGPNPIACLRPCRPFAEALCSNGVADHAISINVILVLDGSFGCYTRSDAMIRQELRRSLQRKLKWLRCEVLVTDSVSLQAAGLGVSATRLEL